MLYIDIYRERDRDVFTWPQIEMFSQYIIIIISTLLYYLFEPGRPRGLRPPSAAAPRSTPRRTINNNNNNENDNKKNKKIRKVRILSLSLSLSLSIYLYVCIYIYIYTYVSLSLCVCIYIYIYICINPPLPRRSAAAPRSRPGAPRYILTS